jgi:hypothetical protein
VPQLSANRYQLLSITAGRTRRDVFQDGLTAVFAAGFRALEQRIGFDFSPTIELTDTPSRPYRAFQGEFPSIDGPRRSQRLGAVSTPINEVTVPVPERRAAPGRISG